MMDMDFVKIEMAVNPTFNLEKAICNHGFFMMAPNRWIPSTKTFRRPLRLSDSVTSLVVSISAITNAYSNTLLIRVHGTKSLSSLDKDTILRQVQRMLRISKKDESDITKFHKLHPEAKKTGFGRLFRSPTLFEDAVKSVLLCNCTWQRTLEMARALCELQLELKGAPKPKNLKGKRKRSSIQALRADLDEPKPLRNFPTPEELAALDKKVLETRCNLGFRAQTIVQFAKTFLSKKNLELINEFEGRDVSDPTSYAEFCTMLNKVKGFGPFVCDNILMCNGIYESIPADSETVRHLKQYPSHGRTDCNNKNVKSIIKEVYGKYAPFQCLAYWWELSSWYEAQFGRFSEMPSSSYGSVSGYRVLQV